MVSDFFFPNTGGIEMHIYQLSQALIARGHKVIVITHCYDDRVAITFIKQEDSKRETSPPINDVAGIRYLTHGLKVYYLPNRAFYNQSTFPTLFCSLALMRDILIREEIQVVHAHQEFGALGTESMLHAGMLGLHTCFTNHSLFGFTDASAFLVNSLTKVVQGQVDHVICVSYTSKENQVLRCHLKTDKVSVIPNAVDTASFFPRPENRDESRINIVVVSRLVFRKGVDLLIGVIPLVCAQIPNAHFIIGGDGNKRVDLEEMIERNQLHERVEFLGSVPMGSVRDVLSRGHLFLNCSLTEAFCMAIVEAASCGLMVVSTRVGGVPEVLPPEMMILAEPTSEALAEGVIRAVGMVGQVDPFTLHRAVADMYSWKEVATRVERVYEKVCSEPSMALPERIEDLLRIENSWWTWIYAASLGLHQICLNFLDWMWPRGEIEKAIDFPTHLLSHEPSDEKQEEKEEEKEKKTNVKKRK